MFYEKLSKEEQYALFYFANEVIRADGLISAEETAQLQKIFVGVTSDLTEEQSSQIISKANNAAKKGAYIELLSLALSDGVYDEKEKQCMKKIQEKFGLSDEFAKDGVEWLLKYIDIINQAQKLVTEE